MSHEYLTSDAAGCLMALKIVPRASRTEWAGLAGVEAKLRIKAPPVDGAANEAVLEFVAETLGCHRRQVQLVRGLTSRHKLVRIIGVTRGWVLERMTGEG